MNELACNEWITSLQRGRYRLWRKACLRSISLAFLVCFSLISVCSDSGAGSTVEENSLDVPNELKSIWTSESTVLSCAGFAEERCPGWRIREALGYGLSGFPRKKDLY